MILKKHWFLCIGRQGYQEIAETLGISEVNARCENEPNKGKLKKY